MFDDPDPDIADDLSIYVISVDGYGDVAHVCAYSETHAAFVLHDQLEAGDIPAERLKALVSEGWPAPSDIQPLPCDQPRAELIDRG